ncbi:hypothetical protein K491DRAFT_593241 [Lophiostoma macrostomum CBS 122681]|uniref:Increased loss of mitochondrial DNA protein 1 n=1 Tax=Lophiostoma macrostomum CBS 122681 TaxID=1314788 RepID=A0A6A6TG32_9PLEO|nr:hypothetical protein K491DRAFT_593241 [Lophiostoma macrostomum CBS 122681]
MAIISAFTIIRSVSLFHIMLGYFFLTNPRFILDQNIVFILGEAMQLPTPTGFTKPSASTSFLGLIFAFLGLSDLTSVSLPSELSTTYWGTQVPVRLTFLFGITGYTYLFKPGGAFGTQSPSQKYMFSGSDDLKNALVFTWGFLELAIWFWVFITLRDERREAGRKVMERRKAEEDRL